MIYCHSPLLILAGMLSAVMAQTVRAELPMTSQSFTATPLLERDGNEKRQSSSSAATPHIPQLQDLKRPATTVKGWMAQVEAATVQVISVQLNRTDTGLEIVLGTQDNKPLPVDATKFRSQGRFCPVAAAMLACSPAKRSDSAQSANDCKT